VDDEAAIRALIAAYAERLDEGDFNGVAALFEHARVRSGRDGTVREGRAEVRRMYDPVIVYDDGTPRTKHVLANIVVDIDEARTAATAQCTFTVMQAAFDAPLRATLSGRYLDRFARGADGVWRFAERTIHPDLIGDLSLHMDR
jgi:ketosteroid isomerase-like protein